MRYTRTNIPFFFMVGSPAENLDLSALPERKPRARKRTAEATPVAEPVPQLPDANIESLEQEIPSSVTRMDADGTPVRWMVKEGKDGALFLRDETDTRYVHGISKETFFLEQAALELGEQIGEKYWEPYFDVVSEGAPELKEFLAENKGRILEIAARMALKGKATGEEAMKYAVANAKSYTNEKGRVEVDSRKALRDTLNIVIEDNASTKTEEDKKLRVKSQIVHALSAAKHTLNKGEKWSSDQDVNMRIDLLGDEASLQVLVDGQISPIPEKRLDDVRKQMAADRKNAMEALKGDGSIKDLEAIKASVVTDVKDLRTIYIMGEKPLESDEMPIDRGGPEMGLDEATHNSLQANGDIVPNLPIQAQEGENREPSAEEREHTTFSEKPAATVKKPAREHMPPKKKASVRVPVFRDDTERIQQEQEEEKGIISRLGSWFNRLLNG